INQGTLQTSDASMAGFLIGVGSFQNFGLVHSPTGKFLSIGSQPGRASNSGTILADGDIAITSVAGGYNESGGVIDVRAILSMNQTRLHNRVGGTITGNGQIVGPVTTGPFVVNEGIVSPGPALATLTIGDGFQQLATGQLKIDVSGGATLSN